MSGASHVRPPDHRPRRRLVLALAVLATAVLVAATAAAVTRNEGTADVGRAKVGSMEARPPAPAGPDAASTPVVGADALVDVAVATLWLDPSQTRAIDDPSLTNPVDMHRWVSTMTVADKLWLVGKLATQALYGDPVRVLETRGTWAKVVVTGQPSSLHPDGYPGWLPTGQLRRGGGVAPGRSAMVTTLAGQLRDPAHADRSVMELSYGTRLPVLAADAEWVTVATPGDKSGLLARSDVEVSDASRGRVSGTDLVGSARPFSGLSYLWAGTSALGFDCSGLTWAVYRAHGIVIPRDAGDQAAAGWPVDPSQLEPGDLLFYAAGPGTASGAAPGPAGPDIASIHHVAMYVGDGMMIQSPATGRTVETVAVDTPAYAREFWGARRYLRP